MQVFIGQRFANLGMDTGLLSTDAGTHPKDF